MEQTQKARDDRRSRFEAISRETAHATIALIADAIEFNPSSVFHDIAWPTIQSLQPREELNNDCSSGTYSDVVWTEQRPKACEAVTATARSVQIRAFGQFGSSVSRIGSEPDRQKGGHKA